MLKFLVIFLISFFLNAQDSLYQKKEIIPFKESAINLNSLHRPSYRLNETNSFYQYYLNGMNLNDHFTGSYSENLIPDELTDSVHVNKEVYLFRNSILNTIPYTKINIIDGDFAFTDVDVSFRQRLSKSIGLVMGFNNKESLGNASSSFLKEPAIRISADVFLDNDDNKYSVHYFFRRMNLQDYGYLNNNSIFTNIYWKIKDNVDLKLSRLFRERELYFTYSAQSNFQRFSGGDVKSRSETFIFGISDQYKYIDYNAKISYNYKKHPFYIHDYAEIAFAYDLIGKSKHINFKAKHKIYERYFGSKARIEQSFYANLNTNAYGLVLDGTVEIEPLKSQFFLFEKDTDGVTFNQPFYSYYSNKINANTGLSTKKNVTLNAAYEDSIFHIGLKYHLLRDDIFYDQSLKQFKNRDDQNALTAEFGLSTEFWYQEFYLNINYQIQKDSLYPALNKLYLQHKFKTYLFNGLYAELRNRVTFYYESNPLLYHRYLEFFDYDRAIKGNNFRYELDLKLTLKTADIILSLDNIPGLNQTYVRGYHGTSFGTRFGIKWVFYY